MKNARKGEYLKELNKEPRKTRYETQIFLDTGSDLELYETFVSDSDPNFPDVGETITISWIENENQHEILDSVTRSQIGSDKPLSELQSPELVIENKSRRYDKRTYDNENGNKRILSVSISITVRTI
jgi:hypothetical protein